MGTTWPQPYGVVTRIFCAMELSSWLHANGLHSGFEEILRDELGVTEFSDLSFCEAEDLASISFPLSYEQFLAALEPAALELAQDLERVHAEYGSTGFIHVGQMYSNDEFLADESDHTLESCKQLCLDLGGGSFTFSWGSENDRGQATIFKGKANWASAGDADYQAYELDGGEFDEEEYSSDDMYEEY